MTNIAELKENIESIKEYINTEICIKCYEMTKQLEECQRLLDLQVENNAHTT